jgi:long-chain acyl-CoA synthetase
LINLAVMLEHSARAYPDHEAVVLAGAAPKGSGSGEGRLTYAQVNAAASQVAGALAARGIGRGDRVALSCPNLPYFPVVYYGVLKSGATIVPLNVLLNEREIAYHLEDSAAKAYFCFEGTDALPIGKSGLAAFESVPACEHFIMITAPGTATPPGSAPGTASPPTPASPPAPAPASPPAPAWSTLAEFTHELSSRFETVQTAETDTAVVLYTSGTTGKPKGAELSHSNMVQNALLAIQMFGGSPADVHLVTLPLFHSFGQTVQLNAGFGAGARLVLLPRFDPAVALATMGGEGVTFFSGVPTMYWGMLNCREDVTGIAATLRMCVSGGSALPVEVLKNFEERFGVPILEGYGLSETSPIATFNLPDRPRKAGSIGLPVWGIEVKLVTVDGAECGTDEPGEICIRGHNVMKGYLDRPEATAEAIDSHGWFHTGDIGTRDAEGYYFVVDRIKDMIIRGGFNVYPRELEEVLLTHPDVSLAAVLGVPHDSHGEEVKAFVIRKQDATVTEAELVAWCKQNMAAYKYPRIVEFRDALPMTATGKILKRELA